MIGACKVAEDRINGLVAKYGIREVKESVNYILDYSEKRFREELRPGRRAIPWTGFLDWDWGGDTKISTLIAKSS